MNNSEWTFKSRGRSFKYAWQGIAELLKQPNACIHAVVMVLVILAGWFFSLSSTEWCLVILCIAGVFMAEGFNTAIETLADKVSEEFHPLIGKCKDVAAGAVLLMVMGAVAVGLIVFLPKFIAAINTFEMI